MKRLASGGIGRAIRAVYQACPESRLHGNVQIRPFVSTSTLQSSTGMAETSSSSSSSSPYPPQNTRAPAAPPIDFDKSRLNPARVLPASPSYFTGSPRFVDHYLRLDYLRSKYATLPILSPLEAPRANWLKEGELRSAIEEDVPVSKYRKLQKILQRLNQIHPDRMPAEVKSTLEFFTRPGNMLAEEKAVRVPDEKGRAYAIGRRKTSSARVWLVEGDGGVLVNDRNILDHFGRIHDRESVLWPLKSTKRVDKYNVWALVRGGGITGQAEALTVALARALMIHEPALKPILRRAGCVTVDPRQVERKKPGHLKARKRPQWVKR